MLSRSIGLQRLVNHGILDEPFSSAQQVVQHLGAVQAQDYKQSLWAIGSRMQAGDVTTVEAAIEAGLILRTWAMRGTIHFVPATDTLWMLKLCAVRTLAGQQGRRRQLELDDDTLLRCETIFRAALQGRQVLTRSQMLQLVEDAGISIAGQRGYHILAHLGQQGVLAIGPMRGNEQTFVLLEEWAAQRRDLSHDEALAELVTRYFASHGLATTVDFARWTGLTLTETRRGIESVTARLHAEQINGTTHYVALDSRAVPARQERVVKLLAGYDEFFIGYKEHDAVLVPQYAERIVPGNNGVFQPFVVVDGEIVGVWKRTIDRKAITIVVDPFTSFAGVEAHIHAEAQRYGDFIGLPVKVTIH